MPEVVLGREVEVGIGGGVSCPPAVSKEPITDVEGRLVPGML